MVIITNAYPFLVFLRMFTPFWCFYECLPLSGVFTKEIILEHINRTHILVVLK